MSKDVQKESPELLPLRRMASRLGVPAAWLRDRAEAGEVPALRAGSRWLFRPDVVVPVVAAMAAPESKGGAV
ncbi:hypothetical protein CA13_05230 [Planctomycetes bacterium CA13]|uniref:Helix-turn-helix domain protein n=1 Tax=Novipirellula herctigrandis TaxID=2527986 RepID=A0A5C5YVW8_9BACT|nr:hypothetical protein CA13_05230 [Planctomycetes bacterium CA13]